MVHTCITFNQSCLHWACELCTSHYVQNDSVCGHFEHGEFVFDHDEFAHIEHCKFLHLIILLDKFDHVFVCITVKMESTAV